MSVKYLARVAPAHNFQMIVSAEAMAAHNFQMPKRGDWYITKAQPIPILYRILEKRFR